VITGTRRSSSDLRANLAMACAGRPMSRLSTQLRDREPADPQIGVGDNDDRAGGQVVGDLIKVCKEQRGNLAGATTADAPDHDDGRSLGASSGKESSEVGVCGDQNTSMITRVLEDDLVRRSLQALVADVLSTVSRVTEQHC